MLNDRTEEMDASQLQHLRESMDACTAPIAIHNQREFEAAPHRLLECACIFFPDIFQTFIRKGYLR
jgi:hypothetical protein